VIPTSLLAVVVFAASIGPGYVWVSVAETRTPRRRRTQLLELAELVIVGGLASTLAFLVVASITSWAGWLDTEALASDGTSYLLRNPTTALGITFAGLGLAYLGAYLIARLRYRGKPPIIEHGYSAWHRMLGHEAGRSAYATVDLRDGTTIAGWVYLCTVDEVPPAERDLVLMAASKPIKIREPGADTFFDSPDRAVLLNGADVLSVSASYYPATRA
jgi:hypothetical protein